MMDRFLGACRKQPVDATPIWFMRQAGRSLPEYLKIRERNSLLEITRQPELCAEVTLQPVARHGVDAAILFADITLPYEGMGIDCEIRPGVGPVIDRPIRAPADVDRLRRFIPEEHVAPLLEAIGIIRRASQVPLIGFAGGPFTMASYLIEGGPTREFRWVKAFMHAEPAAFADLLDRIVEATVAYLAAQVRAGAQAIQIFDSWIGTLSPYDYRERVLPHVRRLLDELADLPAAAPLPATPVPTIHFGTGTAGLLPLMAEAGGDVIGLDWRIELDRGWSLLGDRAVQGNLDPAVLATSWPAAEDHARAILAAAGGRPGHIFNLGHGVLPHTPVDHLKRLVELVHEETA